MATLALAALVPQTGPDPAAYFNHNDLCHVIQMGALWMLYRGVRWLGTGRCA